MRIILLFLLSSVAFGQLSRATGDEFTILVFHDIHYNDTAGVWQNSVNWVLGASGRGPGGVSGISYYNIKSINGVGDYTSPCTGAGSSCDTAWAGFKAIWDTLYAGYSALGITGVWTQGNHDTYNYSFGTLPAVSYGSNPSWQSTTYDISTVSKGTVHLGIVGVGVGDDLTAGQPARTFVNSAISDPRRQWMLTRHVGPAEGYGISGTLSDPRVSGSDGATDSTGLSFSAASHSFTSTDATTYSTTGVPTILITSCSSGTLTPGNYVIASVGSNVATLATSPGTNLSGCTWKENGAEWCTSCAGIDALNTLLTGFLYPAPSNLLWFATGHYSYGAAMVQVTANDGHLISGIGNNGNDGNEGHVTMFKFQPSLGQVQIAQYLIGITGTPTGALQGAVQTVAWAVEGTAASGLLWSPCPVGR